MALQNNFLNQDIIEEILSRLPVKSLLRFKCGCKSWNALICSPSLARLHLERASKTKILTSTHSGLKLLEYETCFGGEFRLDFPPERQRPVRIMGSCHGLVAVALESDRGFYIWNPLTGDYKELPDPCFPSPMDINKFLDTGFVPSSEDKNFNGFGYDSSTDDYKLFFGVQKSWQRPVSLDCSFKETTISIFSLRKNSWRMIQSPPTNPLLLLFQNHSGCFVNGTLSWLTEEPITEEIIILSFDLRTETFSRLTSPDKRNTRYFAMSMGALDGKLCLTLCNIGFSLNHPYSDYPVELWVMDEYGVDQSWTKLLTIGGRNYSCYFPLCISQGKQIISINAETAFVRSGADGSTVERFRICHCCPENVMFHSIPSSPHHYKAIVYAESLLSPNVNIIQDEEQNQG